MEEEEEKCERLSRTSRGDGRETSPTRRKPGRVDTLTACGSRVIPGDRRVILGGRTGKKTCRRKEEEEEEDISKVTAGTGAEWSFPTVEALLTARTAALGSEEDGTVAAAAAVAVGVSGGRVNRTVRRAAPRNPSNDILQNHHDVTPPSSTVGAEEGAVAAVV